MTGVFAVRRVNVVYCIFCILVVYRAAESPLQHYHYMKESLIMTNDSVRDEDGTASESPSDNEICSNV